MIRLALGPWRGRGFFPNRSSFLKKGRFHGALFSGVLVGNNRDQAEWCQNLVDRLDLKLEEDVSVCILDQGVNRATL